MFEGLYDLMSSHYKTSIDVYELREGDIRSRRLSKSPNIGNLTIKRGVLHFSGVDLAHAVVKADYLITANMEMPGVGFLLQAHNIIDFASPNIKLRPGVSRALSDVSKSSMVGRVGQGLAILYGYSLGLLFVSHLLSHVETLPITSAAFRHKKDQMADFLFSDKGKTVLMESKGSFSIQNNAPTPIKRMLKRSLIEQVDPWMDHLSPTPINGYAVYSCLREAAWGASAMFVVDPEGGDSGEPDAFSSVEQVMRENYGGWLRAMGLYDSASRLLGSSRDTSESSVYDFLISELGGHKFAYPANNMFVSNYPWGVPLAGIDLYVLHAISTVIQFKERRLEELLFDYVPLQLGEASLLSVFPDGSIFGAMHSFDDVVDLSL
ncbi:hypothetical protein LT709_09385 [Pseudomonas syringae pv. syringae]|uniref:hypothetical protein n=1 Tax=Pseudomonas syringae TaxID=317 RepID=UPI00128F82A8|nr:hypothetical protein [Pseudomonas syringae]MCK9701699.1 hypothetical protein [Pseudomonas syringae pv. syringae]MCK9757194.1 hypothetical protein [Pseudomonas syringae pv. syringae]MCK9772185.1 hypothetical protein [Pseudomonas syringae pv. syringae]